MMMMMMMMMMTFRFPDLLFFPLSQKGRPNKHHPLSFSFARPIHTRALLVSSLSRARTSEHDNAAEDDYSGKGESRRRRDSVVLFL